MLSYKKLLFDMHGNQGSVERHWSFLEQMKMHQDNVKAEFIIKVNREKLRIRPDRTWCSDYLASRLRLDWKKSYEDFMSRDSKTTITAVQYLLKHKWYDVGKIDGYLVTLWKNTSKTMDAIKKFQKQNGITPVDGLPGVETIRSILKKCGKVTVKFDY